MSKKTDIAIEKFKRMSSEDIKNMSQTKARELLKQMRSAWSQRAKEMNKATERSGFFYSPAYEGMKKYYEDNPQKGVYRMKKKSLETELNRLNDFFNSATSTVTGSRKVMTNQDIRIFGEGKREGTARRKLARDDRKLLWSAYNEFIKGADTAAIASRNYKKLQAAFGAVVKSTRKKDIQHIMNRVKKILNQVEDIEAGVEVENEDSITTKLLSGSGDDFY